MIQEILKETSTNGRWGMTLVADVEGREEISFPCRGTVKSLGRVEGHNVFQILPDPAAPTWVAVFGDCKILEGGVVVACEDLQSSCTVTLVLLGTQAVVKTYGYKARSSNVTLYIEGVSTPMPASVMLAMGLVEINQETIVEIPHVPPTSSAMAEALKKAGLAC